MRTWLPELSRLDWHGRLSTKYHPSLLHPRPFLQPFVAFLLLLLWPPVLPLLPHLEFLFPCPVPLRNCAVALWSWERSCFSLATSSERGPVLTVDSCGRFWLRLVPSFGSFLKRDSMSAAHCAGWAAASHPARWNYSVVFLCNPSFCMRCSKAESPQSERLVALTWPMEAPVAGQKAMTPGYSSYDCLN